jgi:hypothetical protein
MVAAYFDIEYVPQRIPAWRADRAADALRRRYGLADPTLSAKEIALAVLIACGRGERRAKTERESCWWQRTEDRVRSLIAAMPDGWAYAVHDRFLFTGTIETVYNYLRAEIARDLQRKE